MRSPGKPRIGAAHAALALLAWLAGAAVGCGGAPDAGSAVRIGYASGITTASLWVADQAGYFADQGVDVTWHQMHRPSTALPQLAADNYDVMSLHITAPLFGLIDRGERIRIVADRGHYRGTGCVDGGFVVRRELDLENLPPRMRVSASPNRHSDYLLDRLIAGEQIAGVTWELIDLPAEADLQALARGDIDAAAMDEPILTPALAHGAVRMWLPYAEIFPATQYGILVFGPRLLDRERDLGERFLTAYLRAERELARGKTEENVVRLAEALDFDREFVRDLCWSAVRSDLGVNHESLMDFQRWALDEGHLDRLVPPERYWDGSFAAAAVARLEGRD
jgi:NitT/TauT family transport system substrate-binding protein